MTKRRMIPAAVAGLAIVALATALVTRAQQPAATPRAAATTATPGQTVTALSDGRFLIVGGAGAEQTATLWDPQTRAATPIGPLHTPRAWHTATVLSDGRVLIAGGRRDDIAIGALEVFDPSTGSFSALEAVGTVPRAEHAATLLTDGHVLLTGGTDGNPSAMPTEVLTIDGPTAFATAFDAVASRGHTAALLPDGRVAVTGGRPLNRNAAPFSIVDANALTVLRADALPDLTASAPMVADSLPTNGAGDVPVDARFALRLSLPASAASVTPQSVQLSGPHGAVRVRIVVAEDGRLVFVWPESPLETGATYGLTVSGLVDLRGVPFAPAVLSFSTATEPAGTTVATEPEEWTPNARSRENGWRTERPPSPWEILAPLTAPSGVTAISGRVLTLDGRPLADVSLAVEGDADTRSDRTGRFLLILRSASTGRRVLQIDGKPASHPARRYGYFEYGLTVRTAMTNVLPFTIWMPKLDVAHQVTIPSPTTSEVVVTTPAIPGLELHLPPGTSIRGKDGKPVTTLGITAIPVDRPPFPLARNVRVPIYFTIQPGGAYVRTAGAGGAWLVYPNYHHARIGTRVEFFHYDPGGKDWYVYGLGTVTPTGAQVQPDAATRLYEFTGAMISNNPSPPNDGPPPGDCCNQDGDPVNLSTGLFTLEATDLVLPDVIPIALTRSYRQRDTQDRPFGIGATHPYAMFLWSITNYTQADLVLPDGGRIHYIRTSPGQSYPDAVFTHQETQTTSATPTEFYQSRFTWNGNGWDLILKDGTTYVFGENAPLQAIRDRFGNTVTIARDFGQTGNITQITSPNGRWVKFTYENNHIKTATDNIGRTVTYTYDGAGHLTSVADPENHVTSYTYDADHQMLTVKPPSLQGTQTNLVTNEYTTTADAPTPVGWVKKQTHADGGIYLFAYTFTNGKISRVDVTDPRTHVRRVSFNTDGYTLADTRAFGESATQSDSSDRQAGSNFVTSHTDTLGDVTTTTYDAVGNVKEVTRLPGTPDEAKTTYTYDPVFNQVATITDALNHTTTFEYDAQGNRKSVTDALNHKTSFTYNTIGQVTSVIDPLQHATTYEYAGPDLVKITDPLNRVTRRFFDAAGRLLSQTDPAGQMTRLAYDKVNHLTQVIDPIGGVTTYGYDTPGRLASVTDALTHATTYGYDVFDRLASRTDPLSKVDTFTYDVQGNPYQRTDRKGQVTTRTYDALNRLQQIGYADSSTITYTYDAGNRLTTIADSLNGTITRTYDNLDRLTSETTPQGTISSTYDKADRRATTTVSGQPSVSYGYDAANRLTSVTQGSATVTITYDDANRRSTLTLPNGIVTTYAYDDVSQLTGLTYTVGPTTLGTLTYTYDAVGRRTQVGGTWARTGLPAAITSATYDAVNRLTQWAGQSLTYDANGSLVSDGLTSYAWDARNQLASLSGSTSATFQYDATRRRIGKTLGGSTVQFMYDGSNAIQELANSTPIANTLTGMATDESWSRTDGQGVRYILTDGLGSTIAQTDTAGAPQTQYTYEPFGRTQATGAASTSAAQFTGRENDAPATELYFYRARYFSPGANRFVSEDPIEFEGGINLYVYVHDNPLGFTDPNGTCECSVDVKCRSVHDWRAEIIGALHCYIVVKGKDNQSVTLTGGPEKNSKLLRAWTVPWIDGHDPTEGNSPFDETVYRSVGRSQTCYDVDCLKQKQTQFDALGLNYKSNRGPNSNTFVAWSTKQCGLAVVLPVGAIGRGADVP